MKTRPGSDDHDGVMAREGTLGDIEQARRRLTSRVRAPWWYHVGAALCTASLFVGIGLFMRADEAGTNSGESAATALVILGAILGPALLLASLKHRTGVAVDRYARGLGAWYAVVFGMLAVAMVTQILTGLPHLMFLGAGVAFVATLLLERHIDALLTRRLTAGPQRPAAA